MWLRLKDVAATPPFSGCCAPDTLRRLSLPPSSPGAYLVPYLVLLIIIGIPLFFLELAVGQRIRRGSIGVWHYVCPRLGGIGFSSCIVSRERAAGTSQEGEGLLRGIGFTDRSPGRG